MENLKSKLKNINIVGFHKTKIYLDLRDDIMSSTSFLCEDAKLSERIYCILNDINSIPKCKCGKNVKYGYISKEQGIGYRQHCSIKCRNKFFGEDIRKIYRSGHQPRKCLTCGATTKFYNHNKNQNKKGGYAKFCSNKCANSHPDTQRKRKMSMERNIRGRRKKLKDWLDSISDETTLSSAEISIKFPLYDRAYLRNLLTARNIKYKKNESIYELEWHKKLGDDWVRNFRDEFTNGKEIDLWNESHRIGVEIHGLIYHSTAYKVDKQYHRNKFLNSKNNNYKLFQFFTHELDQKEDICMSMIQNSLGNFQYKYDARKCKLVKIATSNANVFYGKNHLQGSINNKSINMALVFNDDIVCCLSFGRNRYGDGLEIYRFATKLNSICRGGFSKILKRIRQEHQNTLYSFSDCRYSLGNIYENMGFEFVRHSQPGYFYIRSKHPIEIFSRYSMQKHKMSNILEHFDNDLTEEENALNAGYYRVYDAGQYLWRLS